MRARIAAGGAGFPPGPERGTGSVARSAITACTLGLVLHLLSLPAVAAFHLIKIVEVFPGTASNPAAQYVMLQMYAAGENFVGGHFVDVFDANGASLGGGNFGAAVPNGANGSTLFVATADAVALFGIEADLIMTAAIDAAGGAACWGRPFAVDCVAWGEFSAPGALPVSPGTPFNAPAGLVLGQAMHRDIIDGFGNTTNFAFAAPAPKNNAGEIGRLSETPVPDATSTPTPTVTPRDGGCAGDCDASGQVTVDEIVLLVNIALGNADISGCGAGDMNQDGHITVDEVLAAVEKALGGCGSPVVVPTETAVPTTAPPVPPTPTPFLPPFPYLY